MKKTMRGLILPLGLLVAFALWTVAVCCIDVQPIGPGGSAVGFATLNGGFHRLTGVHMMLYTVTDWMGLLPILCVVCFAGLGLYQWITRRRLLQVDKDILALGVYYVVVMAFYVLFELVTVNDRPVLIEGVLETSYPSSTTLLAVCVLPTVMLQLKARMAHPVLRRVALWSLGGLTLFMVGGRLISGVHWLSDIIGGLLLGSALVLLYRFALRRVRQ